MQVRMIKAMISRKKYPLVLIVDFHCLLDAETYNILLRKKKAYMLLSGSALCNMPADPQQCRSEWFRVCRDVSVECGCPVASYCGMTPDMVAKYASDFSKVVTICLVGDDETLDKKLIGEVGSPETREKLKTHAVWFRKNELPGYREAFVLDVSGMSSLEEADALDRLICEKLRSI